MCENLWGGGNSDFPDEKYTYCKESCSQLNYPQFHDQKNIEEFNLVKSTGQYKEKFHALKVVTSKEKLSCQLVSF